MEFRVDTVGFNDPVSAMTTALLVIGPVIYLIVYIKKIRDWLNESKTRGERVEAWANFGFGIFVICICFSGGLFSLISAYTRPTYIIDSNTIAAIEIDTYIMLPRGEKRVSNEDVMINTTRITSVDEIHNAFTLLQFSDHIRLDHDGPLDFYIVKFIDNATNKPISKIIQVEPHSSSRQNVYLMFPRICVFDHQTDGTYAITEVKGVATMQNKQFGKWVEKMAIKSRSRAK